MPADVIVRASAEYHSPWSRVGTNVVGLLTAEECLEKAHLNWETRIVPVEAVLSDERRAVVPKKFATVRSDTLEPLSVVGSVYAPFHNRDSFRFFDEVVASGDAKYEFVGSLNGGRRIFMTAKLPDHTIYVGERDMVEAFLLLTTSHDGTTKIMAAISPLRMTCQNMVRGMLYSAASRWAVRHTKNADRSIAEARRSLQLSVNYMGEFERIANRLFSESISTENFNVVLEDIKVPERAIPVIADIFDNSPNLEEVRGTRWAAWNAVGEWFDHRRRPRTQVAATNAIFYDTSLKDAALKRLLAV